MKTSFHAAFSICTDGQAVQFVKPETMTADERARLAGMFPKKL